MAETPHYGFNPQPEFSVSHIAEYLATDTASQRTKIIRAAKFPRKVEMATYAQVRKAIQATLLKPGFDREGMEALAARMADRARHETGYARDEALRCEKAVRAFVETVNPRSFARMQVFPAPMGQALTIEGVKLKVTMDASVTQETDGVTHAGGIVLLYAFAAGRGSMAPRLKAMSELMLWSLESGQMKPLPRLCMGVDIAGGEIVRASTAHRRFRAHVTEACREIAARWALVAPPEGYDGPDGP